jgi:formyl-CoA transferase/CoA:oxalate CoA-transferase
MTESATNEAGWRGPLAGVKVLDFTRVLAGPFATQILGDLGAEIFKVEPPGSGDETRNFPPHRAGESHYFVAINRSKKSIVVDLRKEEGQQIIRDFIPHIDIVIENYRPGVLDKFGLGYQALSAINPRLIYCAISGFGLTGPMRDKPSFDIVTQALTGAMSVNGEAGGLGVKLGLPMGDLVGGVFGPIAALAALYERNVTGRGRLIDVSLYDGLIGMLAYLPQLAFFTGRDPAPMGNSHPNVVPYRAYEASDGAILIACLTQGFWAKLMQAIGRPELGEAPEYSSMENRRDNRETIDGIISEAIAKRTVAEWDRILEAFDVPHAPILGIRAALSHPQAEAREMVVTTQHPTLGPLKLVGRPIKFPGSPQEPLAPPPTLGQHTTEILRDELDYSPERIETLRKTGVIDNIDPPVAPLRSG